MLRNHQTGKVSLGSFPCLYGDIKRVVIRRNKPRRDRYDHGGAWAHPVFRASAHRDRQPYAHHAKKGLGGDLPFW
jgi:hypothetical protein